MKYTLMSTGCSVMFIRLISLILLIQYPIVTGYEHSLCQRQQEKRLKHLKEIINDRFGLRMKVRTEHS